MRVTISGGTGLIGTRLVPRLTARGDAVTLLATHPDARSRSWESRPWRGVPARASADERSGRLRRPCPPRWRAGVPALDRRGPAARSGRAASRAPASWWRRCLLCQARPRVLVSASAVGYYGAHGAEEVDETTPPGHDFLAQVCVDWEQAANAATALGLRVVTLRTGIVLDAHGGALGTLLRPFKAGLGGPIGTGAQYVPWITLADEVGLILAALDQDTWTGPINATAPHPVTNRAFAQALGQVLHRPAVLPLPGWALRLGLGAVAETVTTGQRALPRRAQALGYRFQHHEITDGLRAALAG